MHDPARKMCVQPIILMRFECPKRAVCCYNHILSGDLRTGAAAGPFQGYGCIGGQGGQIKSG